MTQDERNVRKHLRELTINVGRFLYSIDREMTKPSSPERGSRIASLCNALNMSNDRARYFGLSIDYRRDTPDRKAKEFGTPEWRGVPATAQPDSDGGETD